MNDTDAKFVFGGDKFDATFGIDYLKTTKLFSDTVLSSKFMEITRLTLQDDPGDTVDIAGHGVQARLHCIFTHLPSAYCEIHFNPVETGPAIKLRDFGNTHVANIRYEQIRHDNALIIDQSFLELLRVFLLLMISKKIDITEEQLEAFRYRMLFHVAYQANDYHFIARLPSTKVPSTFINDPGFEKFDSRLLPPIQYIVKHESTHWAYSLFSNEISIKDERASLRQLMRHEYDRALERTNQYRLTKYPAADVLAAANETRAALNYWMEEGWEEILCDFEGQKSAIITAKHAKLPIHVAVTSINVLHMLLSGMQTLCDAIQGLKKNPCIASARYLLTQTLQNIILNQKSKDSIDAAALLHRTANQRFIENIMKPALKKITEIRNEIDPGRLSGRLSGKQIREMMKRHGFSNFETGHIAVVR